MNLLRTAVNYLSFVFAGVLLLLAALVVQILPASWWLKVESVRVEDSRVGNPVIMAVNRTIERDFSGEWLSSLRRLQDGRWVSYCTASGATNYQTDSSLPDPLTLQWWTHPDCHPIDEGKYIMRTTWRIKGMGWLPDKEVRATSNIFVVNP